MAAAKASTRRPASARADASGAPPRLGGCCELRPRLPFSLFSINQVLGKVSEISCRHLFAESLDIQSVARRGNAQRKQMSVDEDMSKKSILGYILTLKWVISHDFSHVT